MFSKSTRVEILLEAAGPDALVGVSQLWRSFAEHEVDCLQDRNPGSIGFGRERSGWQRDGSEFPVNIPHTRGVLWDHGGG